jgi:hypothetical protein
MKRMFLAILTFVAFSTLRAQGDNTVQTTNQQIVDPLLVKQDVHDFGTIPQGKPVYYYFEIVNNGAVPLKLENVQASCGCTTPEWNKDQPIAAGGSDKIRVGYNAAVEGPFEKPITVTYNGGQTKQIRIKGTVWKAPAGSAPTNASVSFLKQQLQ